MTSTQIITTTPTNYPVKETERRVQTQLTQMTDCLATLWANFPKQSDPEFWIRASQTNSGDTVHLPEGPFNESLEVIKSCIVKPDRRDLLKALVKIVQCCKASTMQGFKAAVWTETMIEVLSQYPADTILDACDEWLHHSKWLPAPAEIIEIAKAKDGPRNRLNYILFMARFEYQQRKPRDYPEGVS